MPNDDIPSVRSARSRKSAQTRTAVPTRKPTHHEEPAQAEEIDLSRQTEERSINRLEQIELIAKIAAGVVALTYVSGYLIETTYLGSFGIHADAIEFFRAKYLYIGFHFWFYVSIFVVLLILAKRVFDFARAYQRRTETKGQSECRPITLEDDIGLTTVEIGAIKEILERKNPPEIWFLIQSFGDLRWNVIVSAIVCLFSIQILFMNINNVGRVLPLQFIFLFTIALHQLTHFREYYSYWGILWGRMHAGFIRLVGAFVEACLAIWIAYRVLYRVFSASLRCRGYLVYFLGALPRRRAGKSIWLTLSIEKAIGSKS